MVLSAKDSIKSSPGATHHPTRPGHGVGGSGGGLPARMLPPLPYRVQRRIFALSDDFAQDTQSLLLTDAKHSLNLLLFFSDLLQHLFSYYCNCNKTSVHVQSPEKQERCAERRQ